ncbi:hypothetical protein [Sneathiella sp.]|uniref:hypothetical protein n=1 Tax=Sneathiella sp. TaxID=1964365 RepID=UPI00356B3D79
MAQLKIIRYFILFLTLLSAAGPLARANETKMIVLEISGDPGAKFSGDCHLSSRLGVEKRYRIAGETPAKYWLPADVIRCSLAKQNIQNRLVARILRNDNVEIVQTGPPPLKWLSISSSSGGRAPKGLASASRPLWQ